VLLPCYRWQRRIVVPRAIPLAAEREVSLKTLRAPDRHLHVQLSAGRSSLRRCSKRRPQAQRRADGKRWDVIKTYVRLGLGVASSPAWRSDPARTRTSWCLDAPALFAPHVTWIGSGAAGCFAATCTSS